MGEVLAAGAAWPCELRGSAAATGSIPMLRQVNDARLSAAQY